MTEFQDYTNDVQIFVEGINSGTNLKICFLEIINNQDVPIIDWELTIALNTNLSQPVVLGGELEILNPEKNIYSIKADKTKFAKNTDLSIYGKYVIAFLCDKEFTVKGFTLKGKAIEEIDPEPEPEPGEPVVEFTYEIRPWNEDEQENKGNSIDCWIESDRDIDDFALELSNINILPGDNNIWHAEALFIKENGTYIIQHNVRDIKAYSEYYWGFNTDDLNPQPEFAVFNGELPEPEPEPNPGKGKFNYGKALQFSYLFYEANRSGALPAHNRIEWRGNSTMNDGSDVRRDLTGGYFDAGDHVKFGFPMAYSMTMLAWGAIVFEDAYRNTGQLEIAKDAVGWGTDYFLRCHVVENNRTKEFYGQVGHGETDHNYWGPPETMNVWRPSFKIDPANPGSDLAAETAAALASGSILLDDRKLLENAKKLFEFAERFRGRYSDSITDARSFYKSLTDDRDNLCWAAIWLYRATKENLYLDKAKSYYSSPGRGTTPHDWANKKPGTALLLAMITKEQRYLNDIQVWLDDWVNGVQGQDSIIYTKGGLAWRMKWGSLRFNSTAAFLAGIYYDKIKSEQRYFDFARNQIDYILGDNPTNFSYMVGFGDKYALEPHHRAASGDARGNRPNDNILFGALVGGPKEPNDYSYNDDLYDYIANEVTTDYNAGFTGALAWMYSRFGGEPLSNEELNELPGIQA